MASVACLTDKIIKNDGPECASGYVEWCVWNCFFWHAAKSIVLANAPLLCGFAVGLENDPVTRLVARCGARCSWSFGALASASALSDDAASLRPVALSIRAFPALSTPPCHVSLWSLSRGWLRLCACSIRTGRATGAWVRHAQSFDDCKVSPTFGRLWRGKTPLAHDKRVRKCWPWFDCVQWSPWTVTDALNQFWIVFIVLPRFRNHARIGTWAAECLLG